MKKGIGRESPNYAFSWLASKREAKIPIHCTRHRRTCRFAFLQNSPLSLSSFFLLQTHSLSLSSNQLVSAPSKCISWKIKFHQQPLNTYHDGGFITSLAHSPSYKLGSCRQY
ncbi:hypothetical protein RJT34_16585 [Clitoria ternatea]|uniref:Uncharacterized protein n=1 Tax=Clitoria ternatea TaxID=43366 RepID=A0AAN9J7E2_CLITE